MKIEVISDTEMKLSRMHEAGQELSFQEPDGYYGGIKMFVTSLAACTFAVLASYGQRIEATPANIVFKMQWELSAKPNRVEKISMNIYWPELPDSRWKAAIRAADMCTVHKTIADCVDIETDILMESAD